MDNTKAVPVWAIGLYVTAIVGASLMVGLMPPFVNRPACNPNGLPNSRENALPAAADLTDDFLVREKRADPVAAPQNEYEKKWRNFKDNVEDRVKDQPYYVKKFANNMKSIFDICPEISNPPPPDAAFPWLFSRLPSYIKPVNYLVELILYAFELNAYLGEIELTFDVTEPANYILVHSAENELPVIASFRDRLGNNVAVECIGEYVSARTDYFVIRTVQNIQPSAGPFKIAFLFIDSELRMEKGIFKLDYNFGES
jgi:hypothetical protein